MSTKTIIDIAKIRDNLLKTRTSESMGYVDGVLDFYLAVKKILEEGINEQTEHSRN